MAALRAQFRARAARDGDRSCDWESRFACACGHRYVEIMRESGEHDDCPACGADVAPYSCEPLPADHEAEAQCGGA
jgi:hypothetical protein